MIIPIFVCYISLFIFLRITQACGISFRKSVWTAEPWVSCRTADIFASSLFHKETC